ncbi:hypothetical protein [Myroides odoratus]|uniref:hypothetical protein n=1 Tax=Myroides odoratus TaxID=256 RepID=UPI0039AF7F28
MTTKIQFKLSNDILLTVIQMVEKTDDYVVLSIKDALLVSIKEDLLAKLEDKAKTIQKQVSILDHTKKHAIVLKYHEAYTMYKLLELIFEKETFADHPHIKKIKRLLLDLENKVESFTTENKQGNTMETETATPLNFPRLGVNEIIIEEATILEGESEEKLSAEENEDDNNPILDPTVDINEILVKNYSIFDILEEDSSRESAIDETKSLALEVEVSEQLEAIEDPQDEPMDLSTEETLVVELPVEDAVENSIEVPQVEGQEKENEETEAFVEAPHAEQTPSEEKKVTEHEATTQETNAPKPIEIQQVEEVYSQEEAELQTVAEAQESIQEQIEEESTVPTWTQPLTPPVFDGIVTKTSICIEQETVEPLGDTATEVVEEETLHLFETEELTSKTLDEKVEKEVKREKKKPAKDQSQQGQISLF